MELHLVFEQPSKLLFNFQNPNHVCPSWVAFILSLKQILFFFLLFRAAPAVYGDSQARGPIRAIAACLRHSQHWIQAKSVTYTTAHDNTGSLAYRVRPGIKAATSWLLVGFISAAPQWELLKQIL